MRMVRAAVQAGAHLVKVEPGFCRVGKDNGGDGEGGVVDAILGDFGKGDIDTGRRLAWFSSDQHTT